jgi:WD40 repeat protein
MLSSILVSPVAERNELEPVAAIQAHSNGINALAFSADGKLIASASDDGLVKLWDTAAKKQVAILRGHASSVYSVTFSADGKMLASAGTDRTVRLWDVPDKALRYALIGHRDWVPTVAFAPSGKTLISGSFDNTFKVWDASTGKELASITTTHTNAVRLVAFSNDGKTLATDGGQEVKLWEVASWKERMTLDHGRNWAGAAGFTPDGKTLVNTH